MTRVLHVRLGIFLWTGWTYEWTEQGEKGGSAN